MNSLYHFRKKLGAKGTMLLILAFVLVTTGCTKVTSGSAKSDKEIVIAVSTDVGIDQMDAGSYKGNMAAYPMIYDSLVEYGEKGEIVPSLAESWNISPDGKTYIFHLKKGVKFSDGTAFNAQAVKFSFERWYKDPANSSISVAKALQDLTVVDDLTLKMTFDKSFYPFLTELSFARPVRILSPSAVEPAGDVKGKFLKPIGTGAWLPESYTKDQQAVFVRNPDYWGKKPLLSKIVFKVIPDPQSRVLALQNGSVDISGGEIGVIPSESVPVIKQTSSLSLQETPGTNAYFSIFNYNNPILQDVNVRKAINLAIDKKSIVDKLMGGVGKEAKGLFPLTVPYITKENNKWYGYDSSEAKQLLNQAGYADTNGDQIVEKDGKPLELNLVLQQTEFPEWKPLAEYMQSQLQDVGIKLNLQVLETNAYYDALWQNKKFDLIMYRTYSDAYNPHFFLISLFHKTGDTPAVAWSDAQLETFIDEVVGTVDVKQRQDKYNALFDLMYKRAMFVPLYYPDGIFAVNNRVKGLQLGYTTYSPIQWNELDVAK